jgi:hypothetical protein
MTTPTEKGRRCATSATFSGERAHPIKKRLMAMVDGSEIIIPAIFSEARSAIKLKKATKPPPTINEVMI